MIMMFTACSDELENNTRYDDGYLHFKFSFDENGQWNDDGTQQKQTRLMAPVEITMPDGGGQPLYLHCEEANYIETETPAADSTITRGQRITGEAFEGTGKIKCFGLYGRVGTNETSSYEEVLKMDNEIQRTSLSTEKVDGWYEGTQDLEFANANDMWTAGKNGYFYGFAPFPGPDSDVAGDEDYGKGHARCIMTDFADDGTPTITFTMQPEEKKNKDILTAKTTTAYQDKGNGVEMQFHHVLTALKFKLDGGNDLMYTIGQPGVDAVNYYIHVKSLKLKGIYKKGTAPLGNEYVDVDASTRNSNWQLASTDDENIGDCTAEVTRNYSEITDGTATEETRFLVNTDENCFMVLPQTTPKGAKLIITADLSLSSNPTDESQIYQRNATFEASLYNDGSNTGYTWKPGYTYTYSIKKDNIARKYTLESKVDDVMQGPFSFKAEGGAKSFTVMSKVRTQELGSTTAADEPASWHVEFREKTGTDTWTDWKVGLPDGYTLKDESGNLVGMNTNIPGSTTAKTYTLTAGARSDASTNVSTIQSRQYKGGPDGYYDLSTHGIGYGAAQTARTTANCYIVQGYGKFKLPLVYGNAIKNGVDNPKSYKRFDKEAHVFCNYKGNKITKPYINDDTDTDAAEGIAGAKIVWQDQNIIREENLKIITDNSDNITGSTRFKQYLCFEVLQNDVYPGNAVLAALDASGEIMWSWHIWFTVQDYTQTITLSNSSGTMHMAKWNIGWRDPELARANSTKNYQIRVVQNTPYCKPLTHEVTHGEGYVVIGGSNIVYQHGRKDPFPNTVVTVESYTTSGGNINTIKYKLVDMFDELGVFNYQADKNWVEESIKNPTTVYRYNNGNDNTNEHWMYTKRLQSGSWSNIGYEYYNTWDPDNYGKVSITSGTNNEYTITADNYKAISKTIFDPSPVGFVVPNSGLIKLLSEKSYTSTTTATIDGKTVNAPIPYLVNGDIRLYRSGIRRKLWDNPYDNPLRNQYIAKYGSSDPRATYNLAHFYVDNSNDNETHGFIWTAGLRAQHGAFIGIKNSGVRGPIQYNPQNGNPTNRQFFTCQGMAVRPVKDMITDVEEYDGEASQKFWQKDYTDIDLTRAVTGKTQKWGFDYTTNSELANIVANSSYKSKKVYIQNIVVTYGERTTRVNNITYYGYNGLYGGILKPHTLNDFYTKCDHDSYGDDAFTLLTSISQTHTFLENEWLRVSMSDLTDWTKFVTLKVEKMDIVSVKADVRITYVE